MNGIYPLVIRYIAIEAMAIEIVDLPIDTMVSFHSYIKLPEGSLSSGLEGAKDL